MADGESLVIVIYDISDNKKRLKLSKLLQGYGIRVQKSAFECRLTAEVYGKLIKDVEKIVDEEDYLRIYKITANSIIKVWGDIPLYEEEEFIFI